MKRFFYVFLFVLIVFVAQHIFIAFVPNIIFTLAQFRKPQKENTLIHAPQTDASLRKVVLPNPDFIYSACFFNVHNKDLIISGKFPDSLQYFSIAFYDNTTMPFYVTNNLSNYNKNFCFRLSTIVKEQTTVTAKTKRGVILMRILATNEEQIIKAKAIQQLLKVSVVDKN